MTIDQVNALEHLVLGNHGLGAIKYTTLLVVRPAVLDCEVADFLKIFPAFSSHILGQPQTTRGVTVLNVRTNVYTVKIIVHQ